MKSNDTFGNRTRDLPTCNAVPQATGPHAVSSVCAVLVTDVRMYGAH